MDDVPITKIQISGPTLASLLHRFSSSSGSVHGLLFGHVRVSTPSALSDDPASASTSNSTSELSSSAADGPFFTATITSFISLPSHLPLPLQPLPNPPSSSLLGWFSGRRRTPLRFSLNESTTTHRLSSSTAFSICPQNSNGRNLSLPPSLFLLLTTPLYDQLIHTLEYKAFQYRISTESFEARSLNIINIGPSFRSQYESFSPNSLFPLMPCELRGSIAMAEDEDVLNSGASKKELKDQKEMNMCGEGFEIARFSKLMGSDAANYTAELENLYDQMIAKLEGLVSSVEISSAKVLEQENHNMKLRLKVAGLE
ncbi:hypothetical protein M9H77_22523 [Catharanthus roseus]|uniref:Uncharacterized protein n=1 Tax=Catharanthus roseus TaxID=4058 RepID=A0ACC0ASF7_CATRO|nr:hypothetical protein M9H77_22523 [Catharanthus roseus]